MTTHPRAAGAAAILTVITLALAACSTSPSPSAFPSGGTGACPTAAPTAAEAAAINADAANAVLTTSLGVISIDLYPEAAPIATANFVALARCGFYDGISFHRVLAGFVVQAGDPQTREDRGDFDGLGTGGPGYRFVIEPVAEGYNYDPYVVAMANAGGTDTNGSQFFIDLMDLDGRLPRSYTIFGRVVDGTDVVDAIGAMPVNDPNRGVPINPVVIRSVQIGPNG